MNIFNFRNLANISLLAVFFIGLFSCNSTNPETINLKEDENIRDQVYKQILNDRELTNEFMDQMMNNTQSMYWMMENEEFMQHMFDNENMDYMMQHNDHFTSENMRGMMMRYYSDSSYMGHEAEMMHSENDMEE